MFTGRNSCLSSSLHIIFVCVCVGGVTNKDIRFVSMLMQYAQTVNLAHENFLIEVQYFAPGPSSGKIRLDTVCF